jgi:hypothetical protein
VTHVDLGRHLSATRGLARLKARAAIGLCGLTPDDREDLESQLLLAVCARLPKFDGQRSSLNTFTRCVMDKEVASILRYRLAQRRLLLGRPELLERDGQDHVCGKWPSTIQQQEFWLDVDKVVKTLPMSLRDTVLALCCGSPTEASRNLGTAKSVVYDRIAQIRQAFLAAGVGPKYFALGDGQ